MGFQLHNGILIESFYGSESDRALLDLLPFLSDLERAEDAREAVAAYYHGLE